MEILFGIVFTNFSFIFGVEISKFRLSCGRFSPTEIYAYFENFWISQLTKVKPFRFPTSRYREGFWKWRPGEWGKKGRVMISV
jgi:hypothetical protein